MFLSERIKTDGITIATDTLGGMSDDGLRCRWAVTLHRPDGRTFSLPDPFEQNDEPTAFDVLDLVTGACNIIDRSADRREWASEYTTDPDEQDRHFTQRDFDTWVEINNRLRDFLGHQGHEDYLYDTDRSA